MFKEFSENEKDDDYLSEFKQKIATQQREDMEERRNALQRSRNGFIGTLAGIVLAGIVSWILLMPRFMGSDNGDIPVIRRQITPVKIQPSEPGGMEILNQDKSVYDLVEKKTNEPEKIESILPEPEAPKLPVISPKTENYVPADEEESDIDALIEETIEKDITNDTTDPLEIKPLEENLKPVSNTSGEKINIPEKPAQINVEVRTAESTPVEAKAKTSTKTQKEIATAKTETATETVKKTASTDNSGVRKPVAKTVAESPKEIIPGMWQIQLIASTNKKAVEDAWKDLSATYGILKTLPYEIESATVGSNIFHRLKAGAFATRDEADKVCAEIKKSGGSCLVKQK